MSVLDRFRSFLDDSPSPFHAVVNGARWLESRGFTRIDLGEPHEPLLAGEKGFVVRGGSLFAFRVGAQSPVQAGFRIIAAHTDSPNLRIKPKPAVRSNGYVRIGLEPYGGAILATWTDRDLGIAGRVSLRHGQGVRHELIRVHRPVARIPNLAIHLDRTVNEAGLKINAQTQLPALFSLEGPESTGDPIRTLIASEVGCDPDLLLAWDLGLYDLTPATIGGARQEFLFSARLDNLGSCHAALEAAVDVLEGELPASTSVIALFDHEEIGSQTSRGANGRAIDAVLGRILGEDASPGDFTRALEHTFLLSADMSHAVHPAHADKSEPEHMPKLNAGPVIKQNTNWRYSTEGDGAASFALACERAGVPHQWYVHRSDLACGSTVGPMLAARLGCRSVDVGNPMLSMHSAREMCGAADQAAMVAALVEVLRG
jgi:aspartyl aminopeptidase